MPKQSPFALSVFSEYDQPLMRSATSIGGACGQNIASPAVVLDSRSAPELLSFFGESSFIADAPKPKPANGVRRNSFQEEVARTLAALQESRVSPEPNGKTQIDQNKRHHHRQSSLHSQHSKRTGNKRLNAPDSVNQDFYNEYDREGTPCGSHHTQLTKWQKWRIQEAHPESGQMVMAATTFDPPWRAPADRMGAPINPHPGYHHSAVCCLSPDQIRAERETRRFGKRYGQPCEPGALESVKTRDSFELGASKRTHFMKMNFQNLPFGKVQTIHSAVAEQTPSQLRASRRRRQQLKKPETPLFSAGPPHKNQQFAASQRFNTFQFENKTGDPWYSRHPGHIGDVLPLNRMTAAQLRAHRAALRDPKQRPKLLEMYQPRKAGPGASARRLYLRNC